MKKLVQALCVLFIVCIVVSWGFEIEKRREQNNEYYSACIQSEKKKIMTHQSEEGAIFTYYVPRADWNNPQGMAVNPYFACIAARGLLTPEPTEEELSAVRSYIDWHIRHLETDGSIYDYMLFYQNGVLIEEVQEEPDSIDSYAALFLLLVEDYYEATGDTLYLNEISGYVNLVMNRLLAGIKTNGLSLNSDESGLYYLMDNIEVNAALLSGERLYQEVYSARDDMNASQEIFHTVYEKNRAAILQLLWDAENQRYQIGIDSAGKVLGVESQNKIYPYWSAQLYPQVFGFDCGEEKRDKEIYHNFCSRMNWQELEFRSKPSSSYWCMLVYAAALNQDRRSAEAYLKTMNQSMEVNGTEGFYCGESGFLLKAYEKMFY